MVGSYLPLSTSRRCKQYSCVWFLCGCCLNIMIWGAEKKKEEIKKENKGKEKKDIQMKKRESKQDFKTCKMSFLPLSD